MRTTSLLAAALSVSLCAAAAHAQTDSTTPTGAPALKSQPPDQTVMPPPGNPSAFTPAPVPSIGPAGPRPADRAGNAEDAGPINATPLSGNSAPALGGGPAADAQRRSDPGADIIPSAPPPSPR